MKLRALIDFLPISRRKYAQTLENITIILNGLIESDANHCQIESSLIKEISKKRAKKPGKTKNNNDPAFM